MIFRSKTSQNFNFLKPNFSKRVPSLVGDYLESNDDYNFIEILRFWNRSRVFEQNFVILVTEGAKLIQNELNYGQNFTSVKPARKASRDQKFQYFENFGYGRPP